MKVSMRVEGGQELARRLRALSARASRKVQRDALYAGAEIIRQDASDIAPRAPGAPDIAENIGISTARADDREAVAVAVGPTRGFRYGFYQEFGTRFHGAQPFMRPAFDRNQQRVLGAIQRELWMALRSETGGPNTGGRFL